MCVFLKGVVGQLNFLKGGVCLSMYFLIELEFDKLPVIKCLVLYCMHVKVLRGETSVYWTIFKLSSFGVNCLRTLLCPCLLILTTTTKFIELRFSSYSFAT